MKCPKCKAEISSRNPSCPFCRGVIPSEDVEAEKIATIRMKYGGKTPEDYSHQHRIDKMGALAEMTVAKKLGVKVDDKCRWEGDEGYDLIFRTGYKQRDELLIEVKYSSNPNGNLILRTNNTEKSLIADYYFLVTGIRAQTIVGWADRATIKAHGRYLRFNWGMGYLLEQRFLKPYIDFYEKIVRPQLLDRR